jgi:molybdopterin/thiamine biosynthesis adenylyltransferase
MHTYRLKITDQTFKELQSLVFVDLPKEAAAFALAGVSSYGNTTDIIVRRAVHVPPKHYSVQHEYRLEISPVAINGLIALCEKNQLGAILCHSHPGDIPYSASDDHGEKRVFEALRQFIPRSAPTASLLFHPGGVCGRVWLPEIPKPIPLTEIIVVGRYLRRIRLDSRTLDGNEDISEVVDRQVLAFGKRGQSLIAKTKVGIVGVGGTGSPTAEQLARLGVKDILLIDRDIFEPSNLSRVYGTFESTLKRAWWRRSKQLPMKALLVGNHLRAINPKARIRALASDVLGEETAKHLLDRDIIFLCTDNHWSRSVVNQLSYQYLIPTINLGIRIDPMDGRIGEARGVVDVLRPGLPCLWCSQSLRAERIGAESMPKSDRHFLELEGYVQGIDTPAPSVISFTTTLSGMAVSLFLQLVTDFMGSGGDIARLNHDIMDGTVRRGKASIANECICKKTLGFGDLKALSTLEG